jgi:hypothetical protein
MAKSRHRKNHKKKLQNFKNIQKSRRSSDISQLKEEMIAMQEKAMAKENNGEVPLDSISI